MAEYDSFLFTSPGGREYNEDAVGKRELTIGSLFVLADGLGGHLRGDAASACVTEALLNAGEPQEGDDVSHWLEECVGTANQKLLSMQETLQCRMKSTVVALLLTEDSAVWAHVGDSRLYYLHRGRVATITHDHSVAYAKYRAGEITRSQIATDEDQSSLLRALGNPERNQPELSQSEAPPESGDGFLLCSDGLWEYLNDEEVLVDFLKTDTAQDWGKLLLLRAMDRFQGENDNLSLITVRVL